MLFCAWTVIASFFFMLYCFEAENSISKLQQSNSKRSVVEVETSLPEITRFHSRDASNDRDVLQHRLTTYLDQIPKLEKWFNKFGVLRHVDASLPKDTVIMEIEQIIEQTMEKLQAASKQEFDFSVEELASPKPPEPDTLPAVPNEPLQSEVPPVPSQEEKKKNEDKAKQAPLKKVDKKSKKELEAEEAAALLEPTGPPPPEPGSKEWEFVDRPIELELAGVLVEYWQTIEHTYIKNSKNVFHLLRVEREQMIRFFYEIRKDFVSFLKRPDHKQQFISQWQTDYNSILDDLRIDPEVCADLHQRVDDLRERLWSISDERKERAESERASIISNGWLDDHLGILDNHYITLMQIEVDCYYDTVTVLKNYYYAMEGRIPDEFKSDYQCLPLLELPLTTKPLNTSTAVSPAPSEHSSKTSASTALLKKQKSSDSINGISATLEEKKPRIPLISRRVGSPETGSKAKMDKSKPVKVGQKDTVSEEMTVVSDVDEKLLFDAHAMAVTAVDKLFSAEMAAREAEIEAIRLRLIAEEAAKKKMDKKKGPAVKPPTEKKTKDKDLATSPPPGFDESEEEKQKRLDMEQAKLDKERGKQEYATAINDAAITTKMRLDLIKAVALEVVRDLKVKAESTYADMNDLIGAEFLREMQGIDLLCEIMRHAVESGSKIQEELKLESAELVVNQDVRLLRTPSPIALAEPEEDSLPDVFTTKQLQRLYHQFAIKRQESNQHVCYHGVNNSDEFAEITNSSIIPLKTFQEAIHSLMTVSNANDWFPQSWINVPSEKLEQICQHMSVDGEYVDWRRFMLDAAQPWPTPTQSDLLDALSKMHEMDQKNTGFLSKEQFVRVDIWLKAQLKVSMSVGDTSQLSDDRMQQSAQDTTEPMASTFDRMAHLLPILFDIFANNTVFPPVVDYVNLLMYFSVASDPYDGLMRALSVITNTHMPRLPIRHHVKTTQSVNGDSSDEIHPVWHADIPHSAHHSLVPVEALHTVLNHGQNVLPDSYRFSASSLRQENIFAKERLVGVYKELGSDGPMKLSALLEHPVIQDVLTKCTAHKAINILSMVSSLQSDTADTS